MSLAMLNKFAQFDADVRALVDSVVRVQGSLIAIQAKLSDLAARVATIEAHDQHDEMVLSDAKPKAVRRVRA